MHASAVSRELRAMGSPEKAGRLAGFFKTGPGEYGHGDVFIGVTVPEIRSVVARHTGATRLDVEALTKSKVHEERLAGLLLMVWKFEHGTPDEKAMICEHYLKIMGRVNNWDLVDLTAPKILGEWIAGGGDSSVLYRLAGSGSLWERRVAIVSTFAFIRRGIFGDTLKISEILLGDGHDLMHKAVGWMLREVGKRDEKALEGFLDRNAGKMPRTMLRYAIERMPDAKRRAYMRLGKGI